MESDVSQPAVVDKLWMWGETHKKQLLVGIVAVVVLGIVVAFWFVHQNQVQVDANSALAKVLTRAASANTPPADADTFLKVGNDYSSTDAGQRAILLGAAQLFAEGKYDDARGQFQRFLQQYGDSPFAGEALMGIAACLDAQGRAQDALDTYRRVADQYQQNWNVAPQAMLAVARLLVAQGKLMDARGELMDVARNFPGGVSSEAQVRLRELFIAHPELIPQQPTQKSSPMLENPNRQPPSAPSAPAAPGMTSTNRPGALPPFVIKVPPTNKP